MHVPPSNFFRRILRSEALVYKSYFFRTAVLRKLFDIRFSYNHCNFRRVCLLVKMASKTVTTSIEILFTMSEWLSHYLNLCLIRLKHLQRFNQGKSIDRVLIKCLCLIKFDFPFRCTVCTYINSLVIRNRPIT